MCVRCTGLFLDGFSEFCRFLFFASLHAILGCPPRTPPYCMVGSRFVSKEQSQLSFKARAACERRPRGLHSPSPVLPLLARWLGGGAPLGLASRCAAAASSTTSWRRRGREPCILSGWLEE